MRAIFNCGNFRPGQSVWWGQSLLWSIPAFRIHHRNIKKDPYKFWNRNLHLAEVCLSKVFETFTLLLLSGGKIEMKYKNLSWSYVFCRHLRFRFVAIELRSHKCSWVITHSLGRKDVEQFNKLEFYPQQEFLDKTLCKTPDIYRESPEPCAAEDCWCTTMHQQ